MAAISELSRQCVIWFGKPLRQERDALAAAGWQVRTADLAEGSAGIGLRGDDTVVGLVDLRGVGAGNLPQFEQLAAQHHHLSLMAIVPPSSSDQPPVHRLLDQCVDAFTSPVDLPRMIRSLSSLSSTGASCSMGRRGNGHAKPDAPGIDGLVGDSAVMRVTQASIRKYAPVELPVLLTGETGTGKEVAARALHALSRRHARPFAAINCGALPAGLVQSELFGHERGAFTGANARQAGLFESAGGGTVFLDEIGDLPLDAQTNLLRVLQEGKLERVGSHQSIAVDVRVLAATNIDLEQAVADGRFRSDLYYRLNVLRLHMPPLRERGDDIELLARHFLDQFRDRHKTRARGFSLAARRAMHDFAWPGNVRELLNRVQRAAVGAEAELITPQELELPDPDSATSDAASGRGLNGARGAAEQEALLTCLQESNFNISEAARRLRVSRVTVYRLCRKHRLALGELR